MQDDDKPHGEIIIIRRNREEHDDHHGGVWKIAFADFMTAMMAFFLVMWLINASNEETKKAVASYFNPVKLMDTTTNPRGVKNPKYGQESDPDVETDEDSTAVNSNRTQSAAKFDGVNSFEEQAIFSDPYALLSEIAGGLTTDRRSPEIILGEGDAHGTGKGLAGGDQFQDPFDPSAWNMQFGRTEAEQSVELGEKAVTPAAPNGSDIAEDAGTETGGRPLAGEGDETATELGRQLAREESGPTEVPMAGMREEGDQAGISADGRPVDQASSAGSDTLAGTLNNDAMTDPPADGPAETDEDNAQVGAEQERRLAQAQAVADELRQSLAQPAAQTGFAVEVEMREDGSGALVTLADESQAAMFNIGSARPTPELVRVMEKIGSVLARQDGTITIAGHTDARPYRGDDYDNWRLSTARAHMAYYMLVRGGYPEDGVERIEGHAERQPRIPEDGFAAANRRIEIFLRVP